MEENLPKVNDVYIEGYEILEHIGSGGFGSVYKAKHIAMDQIVALKILHQYRAAEMKELKRFQSEAKTLALLNHPNIVKIHTFNSTAEGIPFFDLEYVLGKTLAELRGQRPLPWKTVLPIARAICNGLEYAHNNGVIHYDLKESNILIEGSLESFSALKIVDFGMATATGRTQDLTQSVSIAGSAAIMSPEQWMGKKGDPRTDIYSLGCLLYSLVEGHPPFEANSPFEYAYKHQHEKVPPITQNVSNGVKQSIYRALSKGPEDRQSNPTQLLNELEGQNSKKRISPRYKVTTPLVVAAAGLVTLCLVLWQAQHQEAQVKDVTTQVKPKIIGQEYDYKTMHFLAHNSNSLLELNRLGAKAADNFRDHRQEKKLGEIAESAYSRALELSKTNLSREGLVERLGALKGLAYVKTLFEDRNGAETFNRQACDLAEQHFPDSHVRADVLIQSTQNLYAMGKNYELQVQLLEKALAINKKFWGNAENSQLAAILYHMGRALTELKQYDKAIDKLRSSVKMSAAQDPDLYPGRLCTLWQTYRLQNDLQAADKVAAQFQSTLFISKPYWAFETVRTISDSYIDRGQPEKARALMIEYLKRSPERYKLDSHDRDSIADMERRLGAMSNSRPSKP